MRFSKKSYFAIFLAIDTAQLDMSSKLHAHLLKGYQKDVHPVKKNGNRTEPVSVIFDAQVIRILEVVSLCYQSNFRPHSISEMQGAISFNGMET